MSLLKQRHINALVALHATPEKADGKKMLSHLRKIELEASRAAVAQCNGAACGTTPCYEDIGPRPTAWDAYCERVRDRVAKVFGGRAPYDLVYDTDPRGYALKVKFARPGMQKDLADFGILAYDFTGQ